MRSGNNRIMYPHLNNAPIVEAVIDLRVSDVPVATRALQIDLDGYSAPQELRGLEIGVGFEEDGISRQERSHINGYRYSDPAHGYLVQFRRDGYTTSKLAPYDRWETFEAEARRHWALYKRTAEVDATKVTRIAVRYVNKLLVPNEHGVVLEKYFKNAPDTPDETFPHIEHFFSRMVIPLNEGVRAILIETSEETRVDEDRPKLPLVLDIDVFKDVSESDVDDELIWSTLGQMREHKNRLFFAVMSDDALELCQ